MTDCTACDEWLRNRFSGAYRSDCEHCHARMLASSPAFWESAKAEAITPRYRDALIARWGEKWRDGHALVKRYATSKPPEASMPK